MFTRLSFMMIALALGVHSIGARAATPASGSPANAGPVTLSKVDAETMPEMSVVNIRLSGKPAWRDVSFTDHGSFIQVSLPNTVIPQSGTFVDGAGPHVKKLAAFQLGATDGAVRIFTAENAASIAKAMTAELIEDRVIITIDHAKVAAAPATNGETVVSGTTADDVIAKTVVERDAAPSEIFKNDTPIVIGSNAPNFRARFLAVGMFSGVMLLALAGVWLLRPYLARRRKGSYEEAVQMRMLASLPLAAKQKLALVQVGNEHILVAVGPENINLITTLRQNPVIGNRSFGDMLEESESPVARAPKTLEMRQSPVASLESAPEAPLVKPVRAPIVRGTSKVFDDQDMPPAPKTAQAPRKKTGRLNVAIGDDGVRDMSAETPMPRNGAENAIKDLTRQIRDRLKEIQKS